MGARFFEGSERLEIVKGVEIARRARPWRYDKAVEALTQQVDAIARGDSGEQVWLLSHESAYTGGARSRAGEIFDLGGVPYYETRRGGKVTWHGEGQRVCWVLLNLRRRGWSVRVFLDRLEDWVIEALREFGLEAFGRRHGAFTGVWVATPSGEFKLAAIGVQVRRGVSAHGVAINIFSDLSFFARIAPCGLPAGCMGSVQSLLPDSTEIPTLERFDESLVRALGVLLG